MQMMIRKIFLSTLVLLTQAREVIQDPFTALHNYPLPEHNLQGVDKFCSVTNTFQNTCTIKAKIIHLTYDQIYESKYSLVFDNSQVTCVNTKGEPCSIILKLTQADTSITLQNSSRFVGDQIIIDAPLSQILIFDSSKIDASGQSLNTRGTQKNNLSGANYIGEGGTCDTLDNQTTYGQFDFIPDLATMEESKIQTFKEQSGSMGKQGDAETAGGGKIAIFAESLVLKGFGVPISANAKPFETFTAPYKEPGGSGGYIYINTENRYLQNQIAKDVKIEARGGYGINGGSGGVIIFDNKFEVDQEQVNAEGGVSTDESQVEIGCADGAAGTIYFRSANHTKLVVDNKHKRTTKQTNLIALNGDRLSPAQLADEVRIIADSSASILLPFTDTYLMNNFHLHGSSQLRFLVNPQAQLTLQIGEHVMIDSDTHIDFSTIDQVQITALEKSKTEVEFGSVTYGQNLIFQGGLIHIRGRVNLKENTSDMEWHTSKLWFKETQEIHLTEKSSLMAAYIQMHSYGQVMMHEGANVTSLLRHHCNMQEDSHLFSCIVQKSLDQDITPQSFLSNYQNQFKDEISTVDEALTAVSQNYTIYIVSFSKIMLHNSHLAGSRIGLCAPEVDIHNSKLDAKARGCRAGFGLGHGVGNDECPGSGGAHGGKGGIGSITTDHKMCERYQPLPYFSKNEAKYEGSAGGRGGGQTMGGSGGGLIWIASTGKTTLNQTKLDVSGEDGFIPEKGQFGSGGGAGGSIQIITKSIRGNNTELDLSGGNGSVGGGGGGSGGRFANFFLQGFNSSSSENQSIDWNGTIILKGGKGGRLFADINRYKDKELPGVDGNQQDIRLMQALQSGEDGEDGTTQQTKCFGGFSGPFCKPCQKGEFKYDYGFGVCQPCQNKPLNSYYDKIAQSSYMCSYQCDEGLETSDLNPNCLTSLDLQVDKIGGIQGTLLAFLLFCFLTMFLWIMIIIRSRCNQLNQKDEYDSAFQSVLFQDLDDDQQEGILGAQNMHMRDTDIFAHQYRMYLIGENSISYPWYIPKDFPTNALNEVPKDRLLQFIKKEQQTLDWTAVERQTYYLFRLIFPYAADWLHRSHRRKHFRSVSDKLYAQFDHSFWEDFSGKSLRFSSDQDSCQLAYIDFLDYQNTQTNYKGPHLPMNLMLAGNGGLSTPYRVEFTSDPLAKSLVFLNKEKLRKKLPVFFENLNSLLDKLCFFKFNRQTMKDLSEVLQWIELGNKALFQPEQTKLTLYLFENSYQEVHGGSFQQRRRSLPLELSVFEAFPQLFKSLIQFVQIKLLDKSAEIRFGLVVRSTTQLQKKRMQDRIKKISQSVGTNLNESVVISALYNSDDEDNQDFQNKISTKAKGMLSGLNRQSELSDTLLSESKMSEVSLLQHGTHTSKHVKILDKSKRAYDCSIESTRALEIAIQKQQKTCSTCPTRFKSVFYSFWILLFKFHGRAPTNNLSFWFLLFAGSLALEFMVTAILCLHISNPVDNFWVFGFPYLLILPALTLITPVWGVLAIFFGSAQMLKTFSAMNATMVLTNYPITIACLLLANQPAFYVAMVALLIINKIWLSYFGSKVRQHFIYPNFGKNQMKMRETLADLLVLQPQNRQLTPMERAQALIASGKPSSQSNLDKDSSDDDQMSFGIIPTKDLRTNSSDTIKSAASTAADGLDKVALNELVTE